LKKKKIWAGRWFKLERRLRQLVFLTLKWRDFKVCFKRARKGRRRE